MAEIKIQIEIRTKLDQSGRETVKTWWEQEMPFSWQEWSESAEMKRLVAKLNTTPEDLVLYFFSKVKCVRWEDMFRQMLREIDLGPKKIKVFQVFNLDSEKMNEVLLGKRLDLDLTGAGKTMIQKLKTKGYEVLDGSSSNSGIPTSLIVVGELFSGQNLKDDFYSIAEELGIGWFRSGEFYQ